MREPRYARTVCDSPAEMEAIDDLAYGIELSDDVRWDAEAQAWVTDPEPARDGALTTLAQQEPEAADRLIRNPYRVLLARAMTLTAICATDAATREPLAEVVNGHGC